MYEWEERLKGGWTNAVDTHSGTSTVLTYAEIKKQNYQNNEGNRKIDTEKV